MSFSYAFAPGEMVTLKPDAHPAVKLLQDLGMTIPAAVRQLPHIAPGNPRGVRDGRYIVADLATISALRTPTALSIPWALEQIRPELERVAR